MFTHKFIFFPLQRIEMQKNEKVLFWQRKAFLNPRPAVFVDYEVTSLFQVATYFERRIKPQAITSKNS